METNDRILGELQEFKRFAIRRFDTIDKSVITLQSDLGKLRDFKWQAVGFLTAALWLLKHL